MPYNNPYQDNNLKQAYETGYYDVYMWYPCPYEKDTPEYEAWHKGFDDCERDYEDSE